MSAFFRLFVLNFLFWVGYNSTSLLPAYLVSLGASQTFVGFYNILGILLTVIMVVFFGKPLVRLPRVKALRWGFGLFLASALLSWVFAASLPLLAVFKLIGAVSQVFVSTLMLSVLLDLTPPENRAGGIAVYSVAGMITNPISSLAGEAVLRWAGGPALFLLAAALASVALAWSFLIREPAKVPGDEAPLSFRRVVVRPELRHLVVLAFLFGMFYSALISFLPGHTRLTLGEANLSAFLIPFSVVSIGIRLFLGPRLDEHPPRRFLWISFAAVALAQGFLLLPPSWWWVSVAGLFYGMGHSVLYPLLNALFVEMATEDQKAVYSNVFTVANLLGAVVTTPLLGLIGDVAGFGAVAGVLGATALVSVFLVRKRFPRPDTTTAEGRPSGHSS